MDTATSNRPKPQTMMPARMSLLDKVSKRCPMRFKAKRLDDPKFMDTDIRTFIYTMCVLLTGMTLIFFLHTIFEENQPVWTKVVVAINSTIRFLGYLVIAWGAARRNKLAIILSNSIVAVLAIADMLTRVAALVKFLCDNEDDEQEIIVTAPPDYETVEEGPVDLSVAQTSATVATGVIQCFLLFCHVPILLACAIFVNHLTYRKHLPRPYIKDSEHFSGHYYFPDTKDARIWDIKRRP